MNLNPIASRQTPVTSLQVGHGLACPDSAPLVMHPIDRPDSERSTKSGAADIRFEQAAAVMLQRMTGHYLSHSAYLIRKEDEILVHAGGAGLLLTQMAKTLGARGTATVSAPGKGFALT
jgi:hypothetical protein